MSSTNNPNNEEIPVLKDVVKAGDESVIRTSRLGQEVLREIGEAALETENLSPAAINREVAGHSVEQLIDDIVDRHSRAMREELHQLLTQIAVQTSHQK